MGDELQVAAMLFPFLQVAAMLFPFLQVAMLPFNVRSKQVRAAAPFSLEVSKLELPFRIIR